MKNSTADIFILHEMDIPLVFWYQQWLAGDVPFPLKFALKVTHLCNKCQLQQISSHNVPTVRASKKLQLQRIESWPVTFQKL